MARRRTSTQLSINRATALAVLLALALVAAACGSSDDASDSGSKFDIIADEIEGADRDSGLSEAVGDDDAPWSGERAGTDGAGADLYTADEESLAAPEGPATSPDMAPEPVDATVAPTAGSVDDNEFWDEYLLYRQDFFAKGIPVSDVPVDGRQVLTVVDRDGDPVLGALVTVTDQAGAQLGRVMTYADGRAVFLGPTEVDPDSQSRPRLTATIERGEVVASVELEAGAPAQTITLDADLSAPAEVDLLFLIDATGSMADEIERLKASMITVAEDIGALPSSPDVRFGMVVYRDRGDEYITRTFDFTGDVAAFSDALSEVAADGGGDTPEALGAALHDAVEGPTWRDGEAVRLVFLVADAAPHLAGEPGFEDEPDYAVDIQEAAARGIKVFPIASSGLDDQGEFVFRQLAQITMARFVFLTYGSDGASPGDSTPHHVAPEDYDVLALDELIVQLVSDELAHLG